MLGEILVSLIVIKKLIFGGLLENYPRPILACVTVLRDLMGGSLDLD